MQKTIAKKMINQTKFILAIALSLVLLVNLSSAITVKSVSADTLSPGQQGSIKIEVENELKDDVDLVSIKLDLANLPFTPVGTSEDSIDSLDEGDDEEFTFRVKSANNIIPGDYKIPYTISYVLDKETKTRSGSIGITVKGNADLSFPIETGKPIIGMQDRLTLKIINKGFADARFLSVKINPLGFTLLSDREAYIGTVDSDDFETISFNVIYNDKTPVLLAEIEYKDFDNNNIKKTINIPVVVYSQEKALELGLIEKNNTLLYFAVIVTLVLIIILYRVVRKSIRKAARNKISQA